MRFLRQLVATASVMVGLILIAGLHGQGVGGGGVGGTDSSLPPSATNSLASTQWVNSVAGARVATNDASYLQIPVTITGFTDSASVTWSVANRKGTATASGGGGAGYTPYVCGLQNVADQTISSATDTACTLTNQTLNFGSPYCTNQIGNSVIAIVSGGYYRVNGRTYGKAASITSAYGFIYTNAIAGQIQLDYIYSTAYGFTPCPMNRVFLLPAGITIGLGGGVAGTTTQFSGGSAAYNCFLEVEYLRAP